ncbi:hypothetical protein HD806DRAFT_515773 [Xylariaceae sp. AK1471]|nr:hypothetical protein HD806DRAFT_515773 [Xylariaceae sp. AK1471]
MDPGYLDSTPVRPPPPGKTSNFTNPESRSYQLIVLISVLSALVVLSIALRIHTRLRSARPFGADDWLCIVATVLTLSYSALILELLYQPGGGIIGIHLWDVPLSKFLEYRKGSLADTVLVRIANTTIKVAFFVFYLRLFSPITYVRYMIWIGMAVVITFCVVFVVIDLVACAPLPKEHGNWLAPSLQERCNGLSDNLVTVAVYFSVITDFYTLFIPLHQIPELKMSKQRKIGVSLLFLTGFLAVGAGLASLVIRQDTKIFDRFDFSWTIVPVYAATLVELNVALLCHSMPVVFAVFFSRFTKLGKSVRSWIRERRSPRHSPQHSPQHSVGDSSTHIIPDDTSAPQLPSAPSDTTFSRMPHAPSDVSVHSVNEIQEDEVI